MTFLPGTRKTPKSRPIAVVGKSGEITASPHRHESGRESARPRRVPEASHMAQCLYAVIARLDRATQ
jgi:hypothetical protein